MRGRSKSKKQISKDSLNEHANSHDREAQQLQLQQQQHSGTNNKTKPKKQPIFQISNNNPNQKKITSYFGVGNFSNTNTEYSQQTPEKDAEEQKIEDLKSQLNFKQQEIIKYRNQKEMTENRYSKLYIQSKNYKVKAKDIVLHLIKEQAEKARDQRARINPNLGHFSPDLRYFYEGEDLIKIHKIISEKQKEYKRLQEDLRKIKDQESKMRVKFSRDFMKKEIEKNKIILVLKERDLQVYKEKLKLAHKEQECQYAKLGWPMIKDTHGHERYQTLELLGKGGFGEVYKCFDIEENEIVAIKINNISMDYGEQSAENNLKHLQREVRTQIELKHQNIAQVKEILELKHNRIVFVLQLCSGPELSAYLRKNKSLEEKDAKQIIYQVFSALNYLFGLDKKVIHYDLKPSNIMFHHGTVKILDFGLCKLMDGEESKMALTSQYAGTYWYLPPETFSEFQSKISSKVDVWSAGVIFYELLYGKKPFANGISQKLILQKNLIQKQAVKLIFPDNTPIRHKISQQAKDFISKCLQYDPDDRLSPSQAYSHTYFREFQQK